MVTLFRSGAARWCIRLLADRMPRFGTEARHVDNLHRGLFGATIFFQLRDLLRSNAQVAIKRPDRSRKPRPIPVSTCDPSSFCLSGLSSQSRLPPAQSHRLSISELSPFPEVGFVVVRLLPLRWIQCQPCLPVASHVHFLVRVHVNAVQSVPFVPAARTRSADWMRTCPR